MAKTFAIPLHKKGGWTHAPTTDYAEIGKIYRERLGGPFYPITPDKPLLQCGASSSCTKVFNPNTNTSTGACNGACSYG